MLAYDPRAIPAGPVGNLERYGRELMLHTRAYVPRNVGVGMDCAACHLDAGTKPRAGYLVGTYVRFPQWNARAKRVITLQDRIAECFLYSMNGTPPAYFSREMIAVDAYIAFLSRGLPVGAAPDRSQRFAMTRVPVPDVVSGSHVYADRCVKCHGAQGAGTVKYPPLWGPRSFSDGAGMHRIANMAGFVRNNMPKDHPGTLTDQEAADVAAFVLAHKRPHFLRLRLLAFPREAAGYF